MMVEVGNLKINCSNERFVNEIIINKEYSFMDKLGTVIDIGANLGDFSIYIYDRADVIHAIEPVTEEWGYLIQNVTENNLEKIKTHKLAIYNKNGMTRMTTGGGGGGMVTTREAEAEDVECMTLATFIKENNISYVDLIKIDVEGAEFEIFRAADFPDVADKIHMIVGEIHGSTSDLTAILEPLGFEVLELPGRHFLARRNR